MPTLSAGNLTVDYTDDGQGEPVVLIHSSVSANRQWRALAEALKDRYRGLRYDMRGHGGSGAPRPPYTLAALASDEATQDPIDLAVLTAARAHGLLDDAPERLSFVPFDPSIKRSEALVSEDGARLRVVKGAPLAVAALAPGTPDLRAATERLAAGGRRVIAVAAGPESARELAGPLALVADDRRTGLEPVEPAEARPSQQGVDGRPCQATLPGQDVRPDPQLASPGAQPLDDGRGMGPRPAVRGARPVEQAGLALTTEPADPLRTGLAADPGSLRGLGDRPARPDTFDQETPTSRGQAGTSMGHEGPFSDCGFDTSSRTIGALTPSTTRLGNRPRWSSRPGRALRTR